MAKQKKHYITLELSSILTFGIYSGETVEWILQENPRYLQWLDESIKTHRLSEPVKDLLYESIANIPDIEYDELDA